MGIRQTTSIDDQFRTVIVTEGLFYPNDPDVPAHRYFRRRRLVVDLPGSDLVYRRYTDTEIVIPEPMLA